MLITLVDGAHNDALMAALLVWGVVLALRRHLVWAVVVCACAAAVKAPAALGSGLHRLDVAGLARVGARDDCAPSAVSLAVTAARVRAVDVAGRFRLGLGGQPHLQRRRAQLGRADDGARASPSPTPATCSGWHALSVTTMLTVTRASGFVIALIVTAWLLLAANATPGCASLGLSLIVLVVLGPVVQPWYFVWGIALLSASYVGRQHFWILLLSITGPFAGLPGGRDLVTGLVHSNLLLIATAIVVLGGVLVVPMGRWTQWSWAQEPSDVAAALVETRRARRTGTRPRRASDCACGRPRSRFPPG